MLRFTGSSVFPGGLFRCTFAATGGKSYLLESSADLRNWTAVKTALTSASGEHSEPSGNQPRYFRLRVP
jgi:hypothetical protein